MVPWTERGCVEDQPQHVEKPERTGWFEPAAAGSSSLRSSEHSRAPQRRAFHHSSPAFNHTLLIATQGIKEAPAKMKLDTRTSKAVKICERRNVLIPCASKF